MLRPWARRALDLAAARLEAGDAVEADAPGADAPTEDALTDGGELLADGREEAAPVSESSAVGCLLTLPLLGF